MTLFVCLDQKHGMLFHNRRQSKDRYVRKDMLMLSSAAVLWMNGYSSRQFSEDEADNLSVDEAFWLRAEMTDFCFAEVEDVKPCLESADRVIIYRWDRVYPASAVFPFEELSKRWKLNAVSHFAGYSHEEITREVYVR